MDFNNSHLIHPAVQDFDSCDGLCCLCFTLGRQARNNKGGDGGIEFVS